MSEVGKFYLKINFIPNRLEKYMSFNINNKLIFIDSLQFLSSSLDSVVKNLGKDNTKYVSQESNSKVLDLVKQKEFYPYKHISGFEKFREILPNKGKFYSSLTGKKISGKEYERVPKFWNRFEMKTMKDYHDL